jgi:hypothetical protein
MKLDCITAGQEITIASPNGCCEYGDHEKGEENPLLFGVLRAGTPEGGFVAFVPALQGCHTQGETLEEAESNVKETIAWKVIRAPTEPDLSKTAKREAI